MAGWTFTGATVGIGTLHENPDNHLKVLAHPTLAAGNAAWLQAFAFKVGNEWALETKRRTIATTVSISANNSSGDVNGVGTLVITLVSA